jgi:electron transfer flavoprotein alpha subunit
MSKDIFVFVEQRDAKLQSVGYELIGEAASLAQDLNQQVVAVLIGDKVGHHAEELIAYGADKVLVVDDPILGEYMTEPYAKAMTAVIKEKEPEIVLFGATSIGRDLAPRVSARIKTGLTADCTALRIDPETKLLMMTRPAFGGNLMAVIWCKTHRPQMATVRPGVMQPMERDESRKGAIEHVNVAFSESDKTVEILEVVKKTRTAADITQAKCLVSGGRAMGGKEAFGMLRELADLLGGDVSASRAAVDSGWLNKERQVGQTGKTVRPDLYLACGISGAIQHVAGMENSGTIIAINKNDTAPIFGVADLGIVGDLTLILPKLRDAIKKAREKGVNYTAPSSEQYVGMENILYHVQNDIAYLTINRPRQMNALNRKTLQEISSVADKLKNDDSIKVLIVRGAGGRAFVAGADISEMQNMNEAEGREISLMAQEVFVKIKELPQIVIAAINGFTLGGGNELAMACDIRIASSRAKFGQPEVNLGLIPGFTGTQRLSRLVGSGTAKQIIFTTDMLSAEEALRIGLVDAVVPPEGLMRTSRDLALKIMSKSIKAIKLAKKSINEGMPLEFSQGLLVENDCWTKCFAEDGDGYEGMSAFVEKRKADFSKAPKRV